MSDFTVKKVRRKNASDVLIFSKDSQLVREENKKRRKTRQKPKQLISSKRVENLHNTTNA